MEEEEKEDIKDINLNLRSEEVQDILTFVPGWTIRWGITALFLVLFLAFITSYFIKYPDVVSSRVIITTENPPARIVANTAGKLIDLSVKENEYVKKNTFMAAIEGAASVDDLKTLTKELEEFGKIVSDTGQWRNFHFTSELALGELQSDYSQLLQSISAYSFFNGTNYYPLKIQLLESQVEYYEILNDILRRKKGLNEKELILAEKKYKTDKQLYDQKITSGADYDNAESSYLRGQTAAMEADIPILNNEIQLSEYEKTIADLKHQYDQQQNELKLGVEENYKKMNSQLALWEKRYLFIAPIDGRVAFFKFWNNNQYVNLGEEFMTIVPDSNQIIGKIYVPGNGVGKIKIGQRVKIKLDNYPYDKFGIVNGEVLSISSISRENQYLVNVYLPEKLTTSYHKTLDFKQEMQGTSEIITEDMRLIERFFNQLRSMKENN